MRPRSRAGALSALCLLVAFATRGLDGNPESAPCPVLGAARAFASAAGDAKAAELAAESALPACAAALATPQDAAPPPSFDSEVEPNDAPNTPTAIFFYGGVGILAAEINGPGDEDYYRFFSTGPSRIWLQTDSGGESGVGASSRDTVLDLYGVDGATLIENDDDDGTGSGGDATLETGLASSIAGRVVPDGASYVRVRAFAADKVIRPYRLLALMTQGSGTAESEPNNTAATANALAAPSGLKTGTIGAAGDSDYYSINVLAGSVLVVSADGDPERDGTGTDLVLEIRNSADQLIKTVDSSITGSLPDPPSEATNYTIPVSGVYYVRVRHFSAGGTGTYHLAVGTLLVNPAPAALQVDGPGNGVWEPGETVEMRPSWRNIGTGSISFTSVLAELTGPAGAVYTIPHFVSDYGTLAAGATGDCGLNCFSISVTDPASRPALHWDASGFEGVSTEVSRSWALHIGRSFADVPTSNPFYAYVENLLHHGVTGGCSSTTYCPGNPALRKQMAVFVLKAAFGPTYVAPGPSGVFTDVPIADPFAPWIEDLYTRGVVAGCGPGPTFCPDNAVNRQQMAAFLLKTLEGAAYTPPACTGVFTDVPCSNAFAPWIEELYDRGIAAGCGAGKFCPTNPTTRGQMAPFLSKTFGLTLYGP